MGREHDHSWRTDQWSPATAATTTSAVTAAAASVISSTRGIAHTQKHTRTRIIYFSLFYVCHIRRRVCNIWPRSKRSMSAWLLECCILDNHSMFLCFQTFINVWFLRAECETMFHVQPHSDMIAQLQATGIHTIQPIVQSLCRLKLMHWSEHIIPPSPLFLFLCLIFSSVHMTSLCQQCIQLYS